MITLPSANTSLLLGAGTYVEAGLILCGRHEGTSSLKGYYKTLLLPIAYSVRGQSQTSTFSLLRLFGNHIDHVAIYGGLLLVSCLYRIIVQQTEY